MWSHISSWALFLPLSAKKREDNAFSLFSCRYRQKVLYLQSKYKRKLADKIWIIYQ